MTIANEYGCEEVRLRLDDYLDQELSSEEMHLMLQHLQSCERCAPMSHRAYIELAEMRAILQEIALPDVLLPRISAHLAAFPRAGTDS